MYQWRHWYWGWNAEDSTGNVAKSQLWQWICYTYLVPKPRGITHTTLTETATKVVRVLQTLPGIKMIAPGIIDAKRSGKRFVTVVYTTAGFELIISGTGVQKIAVHTTTKDTAALIENLKSTKSLRAFTWKERQRKPGI